MFCSLYKKPFVDLGQVVHSVNCITLMEHRLTNGQPSSIRWIAKGFVEIIKAITLEAHKPRVHLSNGFLDRLLKSSPNSHDLPDRLH